MGASCTAQDPHEMAAESRMDEYTGEGAGFKKLAMVLRKTNEEIFKAPLQHSFLVNLGMVMAQCKKEERYKVPFSSGKFSEIPVLMRAARYAKYAQAAHSAHQEDIVKVIMGSEEEFNGNVEVLFVEKPTAAATAKGYTHFFIALDKATNEIVLAIRGRTGMKDAITEAVSRTSPMMGGNAHAGILSDSEYVMEHARAPLEEALKNSPNSPLAIVGHSIGAGAAILVTLQAFGEGSAVDQLRKANKVKCYAFAPPPVFEPANKLPAWSNSAIYSFVYSMDCIPRVSLGSIGKLLMAIRKVDELELDGPARVQVIDGTEDAPETLADYEEVPEELREELKSLFGVGTVILLFKSADGKMNCEKAQREQLDRILIHPDMAKDHQLAGYEESLVEMLMLLQRTKGCC